MQVVINGRFLDQPVTGVQRYAREVVGAIARLVEEEDPAAAGMSFVIARPPSDKPRFEADLPETRIGRSGGHRWEQTTLARFARDRTLLNLCNSAPLFAQRSIVCVHDAHVWHMPQNYSRAFRLWYRFMQPAVLRRSRSWTTVSNYSAQSLVACGAANRPPDAITHPSGETLLAVSPQDSSVGNRLPPRFVLALGSASPNKNLALVARIAPALAERGIATVVAGGSNSMVFGKAASLGHGLIQLGRVSDADLVLLYRRAQAFLFPSFEEGFGIPPVEAMALDCPVIASNSSAMPEVLGDAAELLPPTETALWIDAVLRLDANHSERDAMIERGRRRAGRYTWRATAKKFLTLVRQTDRPVGGS